MSVALVAVVLLFQATASSDEVAGARVSENGIVAAALPDGAELDALEQSVASRLRCPVCQQLSILDSPAELAQEMKAVVRERLAAGQSEEEVVAYFVSKYGEWILLDPPKRGFNLTVWLMPIAALGGGGLLLGFAFRRWLGVGDVDADHV